MSAQALAAEDQARANFYALLARLFYAPPDRDLLETLAAADEIAAEGGNRAFALAWRDLKREAAATNPEAAREEYESVFVGTGKAVITLYTGAYTVKTALDNPLVEIRDFLASRGMARKWGIHEPEDHVAALCEVMRHLVTQGTAAVQREFFEKFLWSAFDPLCDAIAHCDSVSFYRPVARFAARFFEIEHAAFDME
jgi:TorA maturation chaperone TorD